MISGTHAAAGDTVDTVEELIVRFVRHRPAQVEARIGVGVIVDAGLDVAVLQPVHIRALADAVDDAAGVRTAVENRGWPLQHLDALEIEPLDPIGAEPGRKELQPIEEIAGILRLKPADEEEIVAGVVAERVRPHAGRVIERIVDRSGVQLGDLLRTDHRNGFGRLDERRRRFRRRGALARNEAVDRADGRAIRSQRTGCRAAHDHIG